MNKKAYQTPLSLSLDLNLENFIASSFELTSEDVDGSNRSQKKDMWGGEGKIWK